MLNAQKAVFFVLMASLCAQGAMGQPVSFEGSWIQRTCARAAESCGYFSLTLIQREKVLCGSHQIASDNQAMIDGESSTMSIVGSIVGNSAFLALKSDRDGTAFLARLTPSADRVAWRIVGMVGGGADGVVVSAADLRSDRAQMTVSPKLIKSCEAVFRDAP
jgi:hypothetical protein